MNPLPTTTQTAPTSSVGHTPHDTIHDAPPEQTAMPRLGTAARVLIPVGLFLSLIAIGVAAVAFGALPKIRSDAALKQDVTDRAAARPRITFTTALAAPVTQTITLPARLEARQEVAIYPRESGYVQQLTADLGDTVKQDAVLAVIITPVLDEQLRVADAAIAVAEARISQAAAQADLSRASLQRVEAVGTSGAVSAETIDQARATAAADAASLAMTRASLLSAKADRDRVAEQKRQATILAPFTGEITQRGYDVGALVIADKTDTNRPLYRITDREEVRLFIDLPQSAAVAILPGQEVRVLIRELPARTFIGRVVRAAAALDSTTRTRLVEARIDNKDHTLLPGMFANAAIEIAREPRPIILPGEAILTRTGKTQVAVIDAENKIRYRSVIITRDTGAQIELATGIDPGDRVAVNMTMQLDEGTTVDPVDRSAKAP